MQTNRRPRRVRRTPEQIRIILEGYERGSAGAHDFATSQGIAVSTLWAWRRRYGTGSQRRPHFVEVRKPSLPDLSGTAQARFADGLVVELMGGFEVERIAQLLQLLRQG